MHFFTMTRIYRDPEDAISLRDVWTIVDGELKWRRGIRVGAPAERKRARVFAS